MVFKPYPQCYSLLYVPVICYSHICYIYIAWFMQSDWSSWCIILLHFFFFTARSKLVPKPVPALISVLDALCLSFPWVCTGELLLTIHHLSYMQVLMPLSFYIIWNNWVTPLTTSSSLILSFLCLTLRLYFTIPKEFHLSTLRFILGVPWYYPHFAGISRLA